MNLGARMEAEPPRTPAYGTWHRDRDGLWALDLYDMRSRFVTRYGWDTPDEIVADVWNAWPHLEIAINRVVEGVEISDYWERPERGIW